MKKKEKEKSKTTKAGTQINGPFWTGWDYYDASNNLRAL